MATRTRPSPVKMLGEDLREDGEKGRVRGHLELKARALRRARHAEDTDEHRGRLVLLQQRREATGCLDGAGERKDGLRPEDGRARRGGSVEHDALWLVGLRRRR